MGVTTDGGGTGVTTDDGGMGEYQLTLTQRTTQNELQRNISIEK